MWKGGFVRVTLIALIGIEHVLDRQVFQRVANNDSLEAIIVGNGANRRRYNYQPGEELSIKYLEPIVAERSAIPESYTGYQVKRSE